MERTQDEELPELLEDTACTFADWREAGYFVRKGQKSRDRDALGQAVFTLDLSLIHI